MLIMDSKCVSGRAVGSSAQRCLIRFLLTASCILIPTPALTAVAQIEDQREVQLKRSDEVSQWPKRANRFALIIGVNEYQNAAVTDLEGAANDARDLEQALLDYAGFPRENVTTLISDRSVNMSIESLPTKANIEDNLTDILVRAKSRGKDSLVLVAFSGHGTVSRRQQRGEAFLLPMDGFLSRLESTALKLSELRNEIEQSGVEQVMVIVDACRNDPEAGKAANDNLMNGAYEAGLNFQRRNQGIKAFVTLYATSVNQRAYEFNEGGKKRGYFTYSFVEALSGGAANARGEVTLEGLIKYLESVVPERVNLRNKGRSQVPFSDIQGYRAGELVIALSGRQPSSGGISNSAPPTPSQGSTADNAGNRSSPSQWPGREQKISSPPPVYANEITFWVRTCNFTELTLECPIYINNQGRRRMILAFALSQQFKGTILTDKFGNQYRPIDISSADMRSTDSISFPLESGVTHEIRLTFKVGPGVGPSGMIKSLTLNWALGEIDPHPYALQQPISFENIPVERMQERPDKQRPALRGGDNQRASVPIVRSGVQLGIYCQAKYGPQATPSAKAGDAYSWRCEFTNSTGERLSYPLDMNDVCKQQYGPSFRAIADSIKDRWSWQCVQK